MCYLTLSGLKNKFESYLYSVGTRYYNNIVIILYNQLNYKKFTLKETSAKYIIGEYQLKPERDPGNYRNWSIFC